MPRVSRRRIALVIVIVIVSSAAAGWAAASRVLSPAEVAARTAAPEPSRIVVPVEHRALSSDVVTRGTGRFGSPQQLSVATSALKATPAIVTSVLAGGTELHEGSPTLTATGRPLFLLAGDRLGMRDLGPGLVGEDVRQLEDALVRLGFDPGPVDGAYDAGTEAGVANWYETGGFTPFRATDEQLATIRSREADLTAARVEQTASRDSVATARAELVAAQLALDDARRAAPPAHLAVDAARADADAAIQAARADLAARTTTLNELLSPPGQPARSSEIATARTERDVAIATLDAALRNGDLTVAEADANATKADNTVIATGAAAQAASTKVVSAEEAAGDRGAATNAAVTEVGLARQRAGVQVPADEVVFARSATVRVSEYQLKAGEPLAGPALTVTDSIAAVDGSLVLADARLVSTGMTVRIDEPDLGIEATGTISQIATAPGTNGADGFHLWFEVTVDDAPPNLVGSSVRIIVPVTATTAEVLVVPVAAVWLGGDGSSHVERDANEGTTTVVVVEPGLSANGYVEVTPVSGDLKAGDLVVVGSTGGDPASDSSATSSPSTDPSTTGPAKAGSGNG